MIHKGSAIHAFTISYAEVSDSVNQFKSGRGCRHAVGLGFCSWCTDISINTGKMDLTSFGIDGIMRTYVVLDKGVSNNGAAQ